MVSINVERINDDYEFIQYNTHLRIIHSTKDDMYQAQSIITACNSNKMAKHWFENQSTKELLQSFDSEKSTAGIPALAKSYEKRDDLPNGLRGYYIHRLLVNHFAMWASPSYAIYIAKLLDSIFEEERKQHQQQIDELKPRAVPDNNKTDYRYLIYKEDVEKEGFIRLHLVRRHKSTWRKVVKHYNNEDERFYYKDDLPISMTPNINIKNIIKSSFGTDDYKIVNSGNCVDIKVEHLPKLHDLIEQYFSNMTCTSKDLTGNDVPVCKAAV